MDQVSLAYFWAAVIAGSILIYVVLDGFDLGVGILFGWTGDEAHRRQMMNVIAPFWDGNETWLVLIGAALFGAFPQVYAIFLPAFYLPVLLLLLALIFRGVAFEFRYRTTRMRPLWDRGFALGSTVVAFVQGAAIGAMINEIPVVDGQFAGSPLHWLSPFALLCGVGLVLGYALLGAGWIVHKADGPLREWAYRRIGWLLLATLAVVVAAFLLTLDRRLRVFDAWAERQWLLIFPVLGALAVGGILAGTWLRRDELPFRATVALFVVAFALPRRQLLALHDPLFADHRGGRGAARLADLPVLRRRPVRLPGRPRLHHRRLLDLQGQGARRLRRWLSGRRRQVDAAVEHEMLKKLLLLAGALIVVGGIAGGALYYLYPVQVSVYRGSDAQLLPVLVCAARHGRDGIEPGRPERRGRCPGACRRRPRRPNRAARIGRATTGH